MICAQESIVNSVYNRCLELELTSLTRLARHRALIRAIALLAREFDAQPIREYPLARYQEDGGQQFTDVVWVSGSTVVAAFEVDSSLRRKSVEKLLLLPAQYKFWIYYGSKDPNAFLATFGVECPVFVINTVCGTVQSMDNSMSGDMTTLVLPNVDNLLDIRQHIQQAILLCWRMLPEKERSFSRVESELTGLVQRLIKDIEAETLALSVTKKVVSADSPLTKIRLQYPKAYEKWTEEEDSLLMREHLNGTSVYGLSNLLQRQPSAIRSRLRKLGIVSN